MRICFTSQGKTMESIVDSRFGRCAWFVFVDPKTEEIEAVRNLAVEAFRGAGVVAAQTVTEKKVKAVITGNIGPNALAILRQAGVSVYQAAGMTVRKALEKYKQGKLAELTVARGGGFGWRRRGQ
jgi:predicted Fe-Mo cluster-binding NifX family protein